MKKTVVDFGGAPVFQELPRWLRGKEPTCRCRMHRRWGFSPWVGKISWRRKWQPTPAFLPEKSHGQRSLGGCSPWLCRVGHARAAERARARAHTHTHTHTQSFSVILASCAIQPHLLDLLHLSYGMTLTLWVMRR